MKIEYAEKIIIAMVRENVQGNKMKKKMRIKNVNMQPGQSQ